MVFFGGVLFPKVKKINSIDKKSLTSPEQWDRTCLFLLVSLNLFITLWQI